MLAIVCAVASSSPFSRKQAVGEHRAAARDPRTNKADLLAEVIDNAGLQVRFYFFELVLLFHSYRITEYFTKIEYNAFCN